MLFKFNNYLNHEKVYFYSDDLWVSVQLSELCITGFIRSCNSKCISGFSGIYFYAQKANPTNYDVINVMNSMPNSTSTRMLDLNGGNYTIEVSKNKVDVVLPYFEDYSTLLSAILIKTDIDLLQRILSSISLRIKRKLDCSDQTEGCEYC